MPKLKTILLALLCLTLYAGCSGEADTPDDEATMEVPEDNPYTAFSGDWMTEAYAIDSDEPLVVVLLKGSENTEGWSMKFTHLDDPVPANNVFLNGDSLVVEVGPYLSALRDNLTVERLTSYLHVDGDTMSGRFQAVYEGGDVLNGRLTATRVE